MTPLPLKFVTTEQLIEIIGLCPGSEALKGLREVASNELINRIMPVMVIPTDPKSPCWAVDPALRGE